MHSKNPGFDALLFQFHNGHAGLALAVNAQAEGAHRSVIFQMLLHRAAEHLRAHRDEFPEYDPENDIFNRCTTDGGFVQIR